MAFKEHLVSLSLMMGACLLFFQISQRGLSDPWIQLALDPEVNEVLSIAIQNQKKLSKYEPEREATSRAQFERTQGLLAHREVLLANRGAISRRYQRVLFVLFALSLCMIAGVQLWRQRNLRRRMLVLQHNLEKLAVGATDLEPVAPKRDLVTRIGRMIEEASQLMAKDRSRLKYLENLEGWRESSRRIAHEVRTPLTAIRLELRQLVRLAHGACDGDMRDRIEHKERSITEELARLSEFTDAFSSFAKTSAPKRKREDLTAFLREFQDLYATAWSNLTLSSTLAVDTLFVDIDRRMTRQVLVNLANNSAKALDAASGTLTFDLRRDRESAVLEIRDDGPGIPESIRDRLFEPYTTTKPVGEGMGLGLAISRKIMLDHDGDLELLGSGPEGTAFRLTFPLAAAPANAPESAAIHTD